MKKIFTFLFTALMSVGMYAETTVTWDSNTISSISMREGGQSFTKDGVTLTLLDGRITGTRDWRGNSVEASFKFSTSLGNFTRIEMTATIRGLEGSGWTETSPGAVWTGDANETTFGNYFKDVTQIVFTIAEPAPAIANSITINGTPQVGDNSISLTYYFDPANVPGLDQGFAPTLKVKCVTDNNWDEIWLSTSEISSGTTTITLDNLGSFQAGKSYDVCFAYNNGSWVDEVFQSFTPAAPATPATTTVTWDSNTLSRIFLYGGEAFPEGGVTLTLLDEEGEIFGPDGIWMGNSGDASFKFSTSLGNFTRIEITATINGLAGSGWTETSPGAVWTGNANETTFGGNFENVSQIVFTIVESQGGTTAVENVQTNHVQATKFFRNGQLLIEKNGKIYNATGAEVK